MVERVARKIRLQAVLYHNDLESVRRAYASIATAVAYVKRHALITDAEVAYGDSSSSPIMSAEMAEEWSRTIPDGGTVPIKYNYFNKNLGSAGGHNHLLEEEITAKGCEEDAFLVLMNPDVVLTPDCLFHLILTLQRPGVGLVDARQLPVEHPKAYAEVSGVTAWCSGAMSMTTSIIFRQVEGYDSENFFLYCDDVDLSWRVNELGYLCVFQPAAVVYHDKRLNPDGSWPASQAERYFSAEAALLLTFKWSRHDKTEAYLQDFKESSDEHLLKAAEAFEKRRAEGRLPKQRDPERRVGVFTSVGYGPNRF